MADDLGKGVSEQFFEDGQRQFEISYERGLLHGAVKRWSEEGQLLYEAAHIEGVLEGPYQRWHPNGCLSEESSYRDGKIHGPYVQYDEDGNELVRLEFENGEPVFDEETKAKMEEADAKQE